MTLQDAVDLAESEVQGMVSLINVLYTRRVSEVAHVGGFPTWTKYSLRRQVSVQILFHKEHMRFQHSQPADNRRHTMARRLRLFESLCIVNSA